MKTYRYIRDVTKQLSVNIQLNLANARALENIIEQRILFRAIKRKDTTTLETTLLGVGGREGKEENGYSFQNEDSFYQSSQPAVQSGQQSKGMIASLTQAPRVWNIGQRW